MQAPAVPRKLAISEIETLNDNATFEIGREELTLFK
jgi:hypothetical protein